MPPNTEQIEETEKRKHARLPAQTPASHVSKNPGGNNRQERINAVSGREDRTHRADKPVGNETKKKKEKVKRKKREKRASIQRESERKGQCESPGGQHLADFATLPSAVAKVARASWHGQHAIVFNHREGATTREKTAKVLTFSSRSSREHGGNGSSQALSCPSEREKRLREPDCTYFRLQPATPLKK